MDNDKDLGNDVRIETVGRSGDKTKVDDTITKFSYNFNCILLLFL